MRRTAAVLLLLLLHGPTAAAASGLDVLGDVLASASGKPTKRPSKGAGAGSCAGDQCQGTSRPPYLDWQAELLPRMKVRAVARPCFGRASRASSARTPALVLLCLVSFGLFAKIARPALPCTHHRGQARCGLTCLFRAHQPRRPVLQQVYADYLQLFTDGDADGEGAGPLRGCVGKRCTNDWQPSGYAKLPFEMVALQTFPNTGTVRATAAPAAPAAAPAPALPPDHPPRLDPVLAPGRPSLAADLGAKAL